MAMTSRFFLDHLEPFPHSLRGRKMPQSSLISIDKNPSSSMICNVCIDFMLPLIVFFGICGYGVFLELGFAQRLEQSRKFARRAGKQWR